MDWFLRRDKKREELKIDTNIVDKHLGDKLFTVMIRAFIYYVITLLLVFQVMFPYAAPFESYEQGSAFIFGTVFVPFFFLGRSVVRCFEAACPHKLEFWSVLVVISAPVFICAAVKASMYPMIGDELIWPPFFAATVSGFLVAKLVYQDRAYMKEFMDSMPGKKHHNLARWSSFAFGQIIKTLPEMIAASLGVILMVYLFGGIAVFIMSRSPFMNESVFSFIYWAAMILGYILLIGTLSDTKEKALNLPKSMYIVVLSLVYVGCNILIMDGLNYAFS